MPHSATKQMRGISQLLRNQHGKETVYIRNIYPCFWRSRQPDKTYSCTIEKTSCIRSLAGREEGAEYHEKNRKIV